MDSFITSSICSITYSIINVFIHSFIYPFIHSFIHSFIPSFIYLPFIVSVCCRTVHKLQLKNTTPSSLNVNTTCVKSISPKMETVDLLTRNVQIISQLWINIWCSIPWLQWPPPYFVAWTQRGNWGTPGAICLQTFFPNLYYFRYEQTNFVRLPFLNE